MTKTKQISRKGKLVARMAAVAALLQAGCAVVPHSSRSEKVSVVQNQKAVGLHFENMTPEEEANLRELITAYGLRSSSGMKLLKEMARQGVTIEFFDKDLNEDRILDAGLSSEDTISLNRKMKENGVSFDNTFFHESEHAVHLKAAHTHGINAHSFASLDDVYVYATLLEGLAYRKAAMCCAEYEGKSKAEVVAEGDNAFRDRMQVSSKPMEERSSYEKAAVALANCETNVLPNQVYFKSNPDWNQVVAILSRDEVKDLPVLPEPSLMFLNLCLLREIQKNPDARTLEDLDISCGLSNRELLRRDDMGIKKMISNLLMETVDACRATPQSVSKDTLYSFLYLIGWPTAQQMEMLERGEKTFDEVREENLAEFSTPDLFDSAIDLIQSPEVQACNIDETRYYGKILQFEKQILCSQSIDKNLRREKTR